MKSNKAEDIKQVEVDIGSPYCRTLSSKEYVLCDISNNKNSYLKSIF